MKHIGVCCMHFALQIRWHLFIGWTGKLAAGYMAYIAMQHLFVPAVFQIAYSDTLLSDHLNDPRLS